MTRTSWLVSILCVVGLGATAGCTTGVAEPMDASIDRQVVIEIDASDAQLPMDSGTDAPPPCSVEEIDCFGTCTRVVEDSLNCGSCGNACPAGVSCALGRCDCAEPMLGCDGLCLDPSSDVMHCGDCDTVCEPGEMCTDGECLLICDAPNEICTNRTPEGAEIRVCADFNTDLMNCGRCNTRCGAGGACTAGRCNCPSGSCGGSCVDWSTDPLNCGSCGITCGTGGVCADGACTSCGDGRASCSGRCIDVMTDSFNCGSCGRVCPGGESCAGGLCTCSPGLTDCGRGCTNHMTDVRNCGGCGIDCGPGGVCAMGMCTCAATLTMCAGSCVDTMASTAHCSGCDMPCPPLVGGVCTAGACGCPAGQIDCSGTCANRMTDRMNCGTCGNVCPGMEVCIAGSCALAPLYHGWPSPIAGCTTTGYNATAPTALGGTYPYNTGDTNACRAWKLAATVCTTMPTGYIGMLNWTCPVSGGFTDPVFGTYCRPPGTQYACSTCPGACNASCIYTPLSLRNCSGSETTQL